MSVFRKALKWTLDYLKGYKDPRYKHNVQKDQNDPYNEYMDYLKNWSVSDGIPSSPYAGNMRPGYYHDAYDAYSRSLDEWNRYQEDQKWQREVDENWKMLYHEEDYNSIANQIKQFEDNGLSKNLIYGSGNGGFIASSGGQVPSIGDYQTEAQDNQSNGARKPGSLADIMQLAGFAQSIYSGMLQNDLVAQNVKRIAAGNKILDLQGIILGREVDDLDNKYNYQASWRDANLNLMSSQASKISEEISQLKSEREYREWLRGYGLNPNDPTIARLLATMSANPQMRDMINDTISLLVSSALQSIPAVGRGVLEGVLPKWTNPFGGSHGKDQDNPLYYKNWKK